MSNKIRTNKYERYELILADADKVRADEKMMDESKEPVVLSQLPTPAYCEMLGLDGHDETHWQAGNYYSMALAQIIILQDKVEALSIQLDGRMF